MCGKERYVHSFSLCEYYKPVVPQNEVMLGVSGSVISGYIHTVMLVEYYYTFVPLQTTFG